MTLALSPAQRCQRFLDRAEQIRHDHVIAGVLAQRVALRQELERVKAAAEQWLVRLG